VDGQIKLGQRSGRYALFAPVEKLVDQGSDRTGQLTTAIEISRLPQPTS
jgi:hypothetical protein